MIDPKIQEKAAATLAQRFVRTSVPVRNAFIATTDENALPPLAQIVKSGRGWDARLRTYLTILWGAIPPTYSVALGAAAYAQVAGVGSARQVRSAITLLADLKLLEIIDDTPGVPNEIRPLHESGNGTPYTAPSQKRAPSRRRGFDDLYIKIPVGLWTKGWITTLTGPALATLLIYMQMGDSRKREDRSKPIWLSPQLAVNRFGISAATRYRGLAELEELGLAFVENTGVAVPPYRATNRQMVHLLLSKLEPD